MIIHYCRRYVQWYTQARLIHSGADSIICKNRIVRSSRVLQCGRSS